MKVLEICQLLEEKAPLAYQEDYDNSGLIFGNPMMEVQKGMLTLDLTPAVMEEAIANNCNLVISHHPFIFKGVKKFPDGAPETTILSLAIRNNVAIYSIHTNLDNILEGLNAFLITKLGIPKYSILNPKHGLIEKLVTFCPSDHAESVRQALFAAGAGTIGSYDRCSFNAPGVGTFRASEISNPYVGEKNKLHFENEERIEVVLPQYLRNKVVRALTGAHPYEEIAYDIYPLLNPLTQVGAGVVGTYEKEIPEAEFLSLVRKTLHVPVIRHSALRSKPVKKVAICSGSGSFLINMALKEGADVFITADLKYHDFFLPSNRMVLADIGHYESEHWVKEWLNAALIEKFPNFAFLISEQNTNPVHYFLK